MKMHMSVFPAFYCIGLGALHETLAQSSHEIMFCFVYCAKSGLLFGFEAIKFPLLTGLPKKTAKNS